MGLDKGNPFLFDGLFDDEGGVVDGAHRGVFFMGLCQNAFLSYSLPPSG